jgi:hypothetical protein
MLAPVLIMKSLRMILEGKDWLIGYKICESDTRAFSLSILTQKCIKTNCKNTEARKAVT